jgi:hypothetical protein
VTLPDLAPGQTYSFLFRCLECRANVNDPSQTKVLELEYLSSPQAEPKIVDHVLVDIRPVAQWMTMQNARETAKTGGEFRPLPLEQWRAHNGANRPRQERDWRYDLPDNAKQVTVAVHGFKVAHHEAVGAFFPTWFRRMYWVGHPVMRRQTARPGAIAEDDEQGCAGECAHTVVISWPGNDGGVLNSVFQEDTERSDEGLQYPEDEFRALQTGYPLAQYLREIKNHGNPKILLIAHSLGNVVANSTLSRPGMENVVEKYIMHDAAMASEVYDPRYFPTPEELTILGVNHAERYGYSRTQAGLDENWIRDWDEAGAVTRLEWTANVRYTEWRDGVGIGFFDLEKLYKTRWRQNTGQRWQGDELTAGNAYSRGDWRGIFAANMGRAEIWNTWSGNDRVLKVPWRLMNLTSKPNPGAGKLRKLGSAAVEAFGSRLPGGYHTLDNIKLQRWMLDDYTDRNNYLIFDKQNGWWNLKRQWAELASWFPAVSKAAGYQPIEALGNRNCNFTAFSTGVFGETHSYLKMTELYTVYKPWVMIKNIFAGNGCTAP